MLIAAACARYTRLPAVDARVPGVCASALAKPLHCWARCAHVWPGKPRQAPASPPAWLDGLTAPSWSLLPPASPPLPTPHPPPPRHLCR